MNSKNIADVPDSSAKSKQTFMSDIAPTLTGICMVLLALASKADEINDLSLQSTATGGDHLFSFSDDFERSNADSLGGKWVDCHSDNPESFEPLGIHDNGVAISDPQTRSGIYYDVPPVPPGPNVPPPPPNRIFPGIGCAWVQTGATRISVKVVWSGNYDADHPPPVSHVEATPLLYITPNNPRYGFGAWPSQLLGRPMIYLGYIGSPPEEFEAIAVGAFPKLDTAPGTPRHVSGTPRIVELRAEQAGKVTVWIDGEQISFNGLNGERGLKTVEVDPTMINSTLHGFAVDAHFVNPVTNIPGIKAIESIHINELE